MQRTRGLIGECDVITMILGGLSGQWALAGQINAAISVNGTLTGQAKPGWMLGGNVGALNSIINRT